MSEILTLVDAEREHILKALQECNGVIGGKNGAAVKLGMARTVLMSRMHKHNISREEIWQGLAPSLPATEDPNVPSPETEKMQRTIRELRSAASKKRTETLASRRIYGSVDYIAVHLFHGEAKMISYARLVAEDGDTRFQAFIEAWDKDHQVPMATHASLTELLKESGINSIDFVVETMRACMKRNMELSNIYAGLTHLGVVKANSKQAMKAKGVKDREMFLQHSGWLPTSKGHTVNVLTQANSNATSVAAAAIGVGEKTENTPLPSFEEQTVDGSKIVRQEFEDPA